MSTSEPGAYTERGDRAEAAAYHGGGVYSGGEFAGGDVERYDRERYDRERYEGEELAAGGAGTKDTDAERPGSDVPDGSWSN